MSRNQTNTYKASNTRLYWFTGKTPEFRWQLRLHASSWHKVKETSLWTSRRKMTRSRGSQQDWSSREQGVSLTDKRWGGRPRQRQFKKLRMCSVPSRLTATLSPYQTFQRQRGWLQALNCWSWNSIFCTAVITSASHKQGRAPHQQQGRTLCLSVCSQKKFAGISFTWGKGTHFFPLIAARPILISLALPL